MEIKTKRLTLREIQESDIDSIVEFAGDLEISQYLLLVPHPYTREDAKFWVNLCEEKAKKEPRTDYELAIELNKKLIGAIALTDINTSQGTASIGYWLGKPHWRQGYMTEAAQAILDYAFKTLNLRRIEVGAFTENEASNELLKKLNFKHEGTKKQSRYSKATGKLHDEHFYGLLKC